MSDILDSISAAWSLVAQSPKIFLTAALALIVATISIARLHYGSIISRRDSEISLLERRLADPAPEESEANKAAPSIPAHRSRFDTVSIRRYRDNIKRVIERIEDGDNSGTTARELNRYVLDLEESRSDIWLDDQLRNVRREFVNTWKKIYQTWQMTAGRRSVGGIYFRNEIEQSENFGPLRDAAARLEAGLQGLPIPDAQEARPPT